MRVIPHIKGPRSAPFIVSFVLIFLALVLLISGALASLIIPLALFGFFAYWIFKKIGNTRYPGEEEPKQKQHKSEPWGDSKKDGGIFSKKSQPYKPGRSMQFNVKKTKFSWFTNNLWLIPLFAVSLLLIYFFRPLFHSIVMSIYATPALWIALLGLIISFFSMKKNALSGMMILFSFLIAGMIMLSLNSLIIENYVVKDIQYNKISSLPLSSEVRILPVEIAARYMQDSLQKSKEKIGSLDAVYLNDTLVWTAPRIPNGKLLYFIEPVNGIMLANAEKVERDTRLIDTVMKVGEGIGITDNIYWKLYKKDFFVTEGDIYYVQPDSTIYTIIPIIKYRFKFPVMMPYYDGIYVVDVNGTFTKYSPEEVSALPYIKGNRAFPQQLARLYVDSYKYHLGVLNTWMFHKDQIEITDVPFGSAQPFLIPTSEGLKWVVATEPYGESYGVFKIFFLDAVTGKVDMYELNEDQTLTGPVKAVDYVKKRFPTIDWSVSTAIEPRPVILQNKLYWMLSITPIDFAGISYTVFVDSQTNDVLAFDTLEGINGFIAGQAAAPVEKEKVVISKEAEISKRIAEIEKNLDDLKTLIQASG